MEVHVRQQRRDHCPLRRPYFRLRTIDPVFQDPGFQPFLDQADDPLSRDPVLDEFTSHSWSMVSKNHECLHRAPSSPSSAVIPPTGRPAHRAGCAPAGSHRRSPESPPRRWRSGPCTTAAGRSCPPGPRCPAAVSVRPAWGCTSSADGFARYAPSCTRSCRSCEVLFQILAVLLHVTPSTPGAALRFNANSLPEQVDV